MCLNQLNVNLICKSCGTFEKSTQSYNRFFAGCHRSGKCYQINNHFVKVEICDLRKQEICFLFNVPFLQTSPS